jgi:uncharacterized protein (DUF58 family)
MDLEYFPLAINLLSKATSNYEIQQEDYADITDVRPYEPSDPLKKVHWKLTAKRGEWIVKNFQSSALNSMALLIDADKRPLPHEECVKLEDQIMEYTVSLMRYCLRSMMPLEILFGRFIRESGRHIGDFESLYSITAKLTFEKQQSASPLLAALDIYLNESSRNVNAVLLTSVLDKPLFEGVLSAVRFGHFIAVIYFVPEDERYINKASEDIFKNLQESGVACVRVAVV